MPRVEELWAFVVADADEDDEGVPAYVKADGLWHPLMGADRDRAMSLMDEAQLTADVMGKPVKLMRSTGLEVVEVVHPRSLS